MMKYIYCLLTIMCGFSCTTGYIGYNSQYCSEDATSEVEDFLIMEYVKLASETEVCLSPFGSTYHYMVREKDHPMDMCGPMPAVVNIECFSNCNTKYYSCLVFHADGFVLEDVLKFGEERIPR